MSNVRKYWQRHPVQLRVTALLALVFMPIWLPIVALIAYRDEVCAEVAGQCRVCWRAVIHGRDA